MGRWRCKPPIGRPAPTWRPGRRDRPTGHGTAIADRRDDYQPVRGGGREYITAEKAVFTVLDAGMVFIEAHVAEASVKRLGMTKAASYELPGETGRFLPITGDGAAGWCSLASMWTPPRARCR